MPLRGGPARVWQPLAACAVSVFLVLSLAWDAGGYFAPSYLRTGEIAFAVLAVLLAVRPPHYNLSTETLTAVGALAGLAVWTGIAAHWSPSPDTGLENMQRALAYTGLFGIALLAAGSGRHSRLLVWLMLAVMVVLVAAGLLSRLYPGLVASDRNAYGGFRLSYPLSYWNAFGALCSMAAVLALGLAADARAPRVLRAAAAAVCVPAVVAMYLSLSRGAWLALAAGLVVLLAMGHRRVTLVLSLGAAGAFSLLAILALRPYPELVDRLSPLRVQEHAGHAYAWRLVVLAVLAGGLQWMLAAAAAEPVVVNSLRIVGRPVLIAVAAVVVVGSLGVYAVKSSAVEGHVADGLHDGSHFVSKQWDDFLQTSAPASGTARLTSAKGTRSEVYRVALDEFRSAPIGGDGAGSFEVDWLRHRKVAQPARNAHSLYIETLGELGLVGFVLLLAFVASLLAAGIRSRVRPAALSRSQAAAATAAVSVYLVHAGVDWDWQVGGLTAAALVLGAALFPYGRRARSSAQAYE